MHRDFGARGLEGERLRAGLEKLLTRVAGELAGEPVRGEISPLFVENDGAERAMLERLSEEGLLDQVLLG
jgi:hypothetical protein